ncbi:MAG: hypothetical protein K5Q00_04510 [Gammaproteobacteria bacterium]|nr:hypothetical protein [Gammaproteobacteria bacterium]
MEQPQNLPTPRNTPPRSKASLLKCVLIVLALLVLWHLIAPLFGIAVGVAGIAVSVVVATIAILCIVVVLSFIWAGMALLLTILGAILWVALALVLFPFLMPFLIPALVIVLVVRLMFLIFRNKD